MQIVSSENKAPQAEHKQASAILRVAAVGFEAALEAYELPAFRAAIAQKAGFEHHLFHNHLEDNGLRQAYPLIQYKLWKGKPMLYCLQDGIDSARHFFVRPDWNIRIGSREVQLRLGEMSIRQYTLRLLDVPVEYTIRNWIPFGKENFHRFRHASEAEQIAMLEAIMTGNILTMARGTGWEVPGMVQIRFSEVTNMKKVPYKGVAHLAFDIRFQANVFLPRYIGLGRKVAVGYGMVFPVRATLSGGDQF